MLELVYGLVAVPEQVASLPTGVQLPDLNRPVRSDGKAAYHNLNIQYIACCSENLEYAQKGENLPT